MLLKLLPEQIPQYWDEIKYGLGKALPSGGPDRRNEILNGMLLGSIQMWVIFRRSDNVITLHSDIVVEGGTVTSVVDDHIHGTKNLLSYATWAVDDGEISRRSWMELFDALKKYARKKDCNRLVTFTDVSSIIKFAKFTGGDATYTFLTWDV